MRTLPCLLLLMLGAMGSPPPKRSSRRPRRFAGSSNKLYKGVPRLFPGR